MMYLKIDNIDKLEKERIKQRLKKLLDEELKDQYLKAINGEENYILIDFEKFLEYFHDIELFGKKIADLLLDNPDFIIELLENVLYEISVESFPKEIEKISIYFKNLPRSTKRKIGEIRSKDVNKFVTIEGIIRRVSQVKVMVVGSIYRCPFCGYEFKVNFDSKLPKICPRCKRRVENYELVENIIDDVQQLVIEDLWENLDPNEQPQRIHVFVRGSLTDPKISKRYTPGNKVIVYGIVDLLPIKKKKKDEQMFVIRANYIESKEYSFEDIEISKDDEEKIKRLANDPKIYDKLINTIAPSIYGHREIKEAIVLQLFGGVTTYRPDGTKSRGDIHILLVGDPGVGKSLPYSQKILYYDDEKNIYFERIGEFVERIIKKSNKIEMDDIIIAYPDENFYVPSINHNLNVELKRIKKVIKHKSKKRLYKIITKGKKELIVTEDHSILVFENNSIVLKKGSDVKRGDILFSLNFEDIIELKEKVVNVKFDIVKDVKEINLEEDLYDLEIEDNNNYFSNFIFVHNSQILLQVANIAPKARFISSKGASAAGITASVVRDEFLGTWAVEAGALVLAHRGILCLDEMDKMSKEDRDALHTAMEQQIVTIDKANIHITLKAETSILAAANPKGGRFTDDKPIIEQINLPPTLLSRFDLIFPIRDIPDEKHDLEIATQVIEAYRKPEVFKPPIDINLLRKYIAYAKKNVFPKLSEEAAEKIKEFYVDIRKKGKENDLVSITTRQLEAIIRLSQASARVRLSNVVTKEDVERAIKLLMASLKEIGIADSQGVIDIDALHTGIPKSKREFRQILLDVLKELSEKEEDGVPLSKIIEELKKHVKEDEEELINKTLELIELLKKSGEIYEPREGRYKVI